MYFEEISKFIQQALREKKRKAHLWFSYWKGDHFQSPRVGSCLALGNESSKETHILTKQNALLGRDARQRTAG